ncbi:MAG TPA: BTAD domain-containing putative transcriptional regulator, partial [Ktedonobacteraceae bacterium]|nr:BTAD domain-containing putative transcriptional regulator [Ktedonobacteraceae bacterium]
MKDEWHEIHTKARRPAPHRAWLCGPFRLERCVGDGYEPVGQWEWGGRTSPRTVLKALLCAPGRQMRRSALAAQLWPETTEVQASREMSVALTFLRKVLRSDDGKEVLEEEGTKGLRLAGQSALWVDADAAAHLLDQAEQMGEHSPTALPLLEKAFSYFERGPFLADDEGEWLVARRAMGERRQYRCRLQLADLYGQQGRIERAETLLNDLLSDDPTDEDVICRLMLLLQQHGFTHQALLVYRQACALFQEEGLELTEATRELATQLTRERYISPVKLIPPQAPALALSPAHFIPSELIVDEEPGKRNGEMVQLFSLVPPRIDLFSVALMGLLLAQHQYRWTLDELRWQIERGMGFFDHMNQKTQAHVSRREALTFLASVPLALWGLTEINGASSPVDPKDILPLYAASIPACWNLFFSGHLAEVAKILPACLSQLTTLAEQPSIHRKSAAGLASQAYQLAALFAKEVQEDF